MTRPLKGYVLIGESPGVYRYGDRWGMPVARHDFVRPIEVSEETWAKLQAFQFERPVPGPVLAWMKTTPADTIYETMRAVAEGKPHPRIPLAVWSFYVDVSRQLQTFGRANTLAQFTAWDPLCQDEVRQVASFAEARYRRWTWFDRYVRLPFTRVQAWATTKVYELALGE